MLILIATSPFGSGVGGDAIGSLGEFFKVIEIVKTNMVMLRQATATIIEVNDRLRLTSTEAQEREEGQSLQPTVDNGNKCAKRVRGLLKDLNREVQGMEDEKSAPTSDIRIRKNLVQTLTRKFVDDLKEYQNIQSQVKELKKKRAVKRVQQVKPNISDEEVEAVIASGQSEELLKQEILQVC